MSDQSDDVDQHAGVPESDPDHIDPAGDLADLLDDQLADAELGEDTDADDLREFIAAAERGEFGPADPALEAQVRIARSILEAVDGGEGDQDQSGGVDQSGNLIGVVLRGWEIDTNADERTAREQTRRAAEWLRDNGGRRTKTDFVDALTDGSELSDRHWWVRAVRPGLHRLAERDLVEYRPGYHDYRWAGDDVDQSDDAISNALHGWGGDLRADADNAREQTRRAAEWLRDNGGRRAKNEFIDALADGSESSWIRAVRPGLHQLAERDLVEYRPGYDDYRWTGGDQDQSDAGDEGDT